MIYVRPRYIESLQMLPVPTSSWTRNPETIRVGEYVYDIITSTASI